MLRKSIFTGLFLYGSFLLSQTNTNDAGNFRTISHKEALDQTTSYSNPSPTQSVKIENTQVWINGNLVGASELPHGLQTLPQNYRMSLSFQGSTEIELTLFGDDYLIKNGKIIEMPKVTPQTNVQTVQPTTTKSENIAQENYYNTKKQETPGLFDRLTREAQLYDQSMRLVLDYQIADETQKEKIREEIRVVIGELFDLTLSDMEFEVAHLEKELVNIKSDIDYRKNNRTKIIENRLKELVGK